MTRLVVVFSVLAVATALAQDEKKGPVEILSLEPRTVAPGDKVTVTFKVTNDTKDRILTVSHPTAPCGAIEWSDGALYLNPAEKVAQAWFVEHDQIVLPGETRQLTKEVVAYTEDVPVTVYWSSHDPSSNKDLLWGEQAVESDGRIRFKKLDLASLAKHERPLVLIFERSEWQKEEKTLHVKVKPRDFSLDAARAKLEKRVEGALWLEDRSAWLLWGRDGTALVSTAAVVSLPAGAAWAFDAASPKTLSFRVPSGSKLDKTFEGTRGTGYRAGTFISVPADRLLEALEVAREEGFAIRKWTFGADRAFLEARPPER